ncbi:FAD-dependent oxidoreductase [Stenotrophomonas sp. NPDC087984]
MRSRWARAHERSRRCSGGRSLRGRALHRGSPAAQGIPGGLTVLGAEPHLPYDRPPPSKRILSGAWEPDRAFLRRTAELSALEAEFVLDDPAVGLDAEARTVHTASGRVLRADAIVVATGLRPRVFAGQDGLAGVHVLRTLDDAWALRAELMASSRLVVVGDGVLGTEIAATARTMGLAVTLAGPQPAPLESQFGALVAGKVAELHTDRGVEPRLGAAVTGPAERNGRVTGVELATGEMLPDETRLRRREVIDAFTS